MLGLLRLQEEAFAASVSSAMHKSTFLGECTTRTGGPVCASAVHWNSELMLQAGSVWRCTSESTILQLHQEVVMLCMWLPSNW